MLHDSVSYVNVPQILIKYRETHLRWDGQKVTLLQLVAIWKVNEPIIYGVLQL